MGFVYTLVDKVCDILDDIDIVPIADTLGTGVFEVVCVVVDVNNRDELLDRVIELLTDNEGSDVLLPDNDTDTVADELVVCVSDTETDGDAVGIGGIIVELTDLLTDADELASLLCDTDVLCDADILRDNDVLTDSDEVGSVLCDIDVVIDNDEVGSLLCDADTDKLGAVLCDNDVLADSDELGAVL